MQIEKVGVVGCGLMGAGIAEICAKSGYETVVREVNDELLTKGLDRIGRSLDKAVCKGKLEENKKEEALGKLTGTTNLEDLADCDLVVEAIIESLEHKCELYAALDGIVKKSGVFASNTSSLTITEMAMATKRTERFLGLHFFNPVPIMKLVEVVRTIMTDDQVFEETKEFIRSLGKEPVSCQDNSGFIVNRLLVPYLLDAIRGLEEGIGTVEDIDKAMQLGCGYPMGPLTLLDFVGLDTTYYIANIMFEEYREKRFAPPPLLKQMVLAGRLGRKSGRGFYDYSNS
jgi:3-hydroxybutyryl-CoA dehydrogenase